MERNKTIFLLIVLVIVVTVAIVILRGTNTPGNSGETIIHRDTTYIREYLRDTIVLVKKEPIERIDTIMVQLPGDTVKVAVILPFERREYATDNYHLTISGYKPELEKIELFLKTKTVIEYRDRTITKAPSWQIGITGGIQAMPNWYNTYAGAKGRYNFGNINIEGTLAYSFNYKQPYGEVKVGIDLWR